MNWYGPERKLKVAINTSVEMWWQNIKTKIIIIEGDTIKSHEYIIPKSKVDHYDENDLYLNISRHDMILSFEFWVICKHLETYKR